jgi:hypothetical protein
VNLTSRPAAASGQLRRRPHVIRQPIVRERTSPAAVRWFGSENLLRLGFGAPRSENRVRGALACSWRGFGAVWFPGS